MAGSSEPQREREVQRYLQTWQVAQGSSFNVALNVDSIAAEHLHGNGYTPQASSDKALTAFAQLAVLRLNVRRAMVSLIDGSTQVILTEATRSVRLDPLDASPQPSRTTNSSSQSSANNIMAEDDLWRKETASPPSPLHCWKLTCDSVGDSRHLDSVTFRCHVRARPHQ